MVVSARHKLRKALEGCRWIGGDHIDRATSRIPSVQRALRNAQDLESLHIEEASKDAGSPLEVDAVEMRGDWPFGASVVYPKADTAQRHIGRTEERRVGKTGVSTWRYPWAAWTKTTKK